MHDAIVVGAGHKGVAGWARYATPIEGLYLCGSGTHPGGGVTGPPGHNAARAVLARYAARR